MNRTSPTVEILSLREQRRIRLDCPACGVPSLMAIRHKVRIQRKVHYHVRCSRCGHEWTQVGRRYNYWRDIKQRYRLDRAQVLALFEGTLRTMMETGELVIQETDKTIRAGRMVFIKPQQR